MALNLIVAYLPAVLGFMPWCPFFPKFGVVPSEEPLPSLGPQQHNTTQQLSNSVHTLLAALTITTGTATGAEELTISLAVYIHLSWTFIQYFQWVAQTILPLQD